MRAVSAVAARRWAENATDAHRRSARLRRAVLRVTGLTPPGLALVTVMVLSWAIGRTIGGRPLYLVSYGILAVLVYAKVSTRRRPPVDAVRSDASPRVHEGATIPLTVTIRSSRRVANVVLEERLPLLFGQQAVLPIASVGAGDEVEHAYEVTAWRRGVYELGPLTIRWGDPFGLTRREATLAEAYPLIVHPGVEPVSDHPLTRMWEDPPFRPPVSRPWPSGMELYGMRHYERGDDVRRIVWRAFQRTGQLLVLEAEQGISDRVVLLLDQDRAQHSRGLVSESFEAGVRAVASLATQHLAEGYEVTVEGNAGTIVGPVRSGPARLRLMDELARLDLHRASLKDGVTRLTQAVSRDVHLLVVTPHLERDALARLELLIQKGIQTTIVALVWDEDATENLTRATSIGAKVVEIRRGTPLSVAFRREVAAAVRA